MSDLIQFDSSTLEEISNGILEDTGIDSLLNGNLLIDEESDDILQAFNDVLFEDDDVKLDIKQDVIANDNVLKEKKNFEAFSDMLTELEEEGADLDPIIDVSDLDEFIKPIATAPVQVPTINHQTLRHLGHSSNLNASYLSNMAKVQEIKTQSANALGKMYPRQYSHPVSHSHAYLQQTNAAIYPPCFPMSLKTSLQRQRLSNNAVALPQLQQIKMPATVAQKDSNKQNSTSKKPLRELKYRDLSNLADEEAAKNCNHKSMRGRTQELFPVKLHLIIERSEEDDYSSIISWSPHGRSFKIHNEVLFVQKVLPKYFFQSKLSSFTRQLRMYGFHKIKNKYNVDKGCFFHELFLRGRPGLACGIPRLSSPCAASRKNEPNLYDFCPMPFPSSKSSTCKANVETNDSVSSDKKVSTSTENNPSWLRVIQYAKSSQAKSTSSSPPTEQVAMKSIEKTQDLSKYPTVPKKKSVPEREQTMKMHVIPPLGNIIHQ